MSRAVIGADPVANTWIIRVVIPTIVVAPVVPGVIRGVRQDQIDLASLPKKRRHRLEIVSFDQAIGSLVYF